MYDRKVDAVVYSRRTFVKATGSVAAATALGAGAAAAPARAEAAELMRLPDMPLHDPYIVADKQTRTYYLYTSNVSSVSGVQGTGTMVYRSENLRDWQKPEVVFLTADQEGIWATRGGWAPEVHKYRGRYYLFTTLHDENKPLPIPPPNRYGTPFQIPNYMRGTIIAVANSPLGPFKVIDPSRPVAPTNFMTLDGTLWVDRRGQPWMVYAHEWLQKIDGTIEAVRLEHDLSGAAEDPIYLFKASDAFWTTEQIPGATAHQITPYVTDGPQVYQAPSGALVMMWSTYEKNVAEDSGTISGNYVQTYAVSRSGTLEGPWEQQRPLVRDDSGHGMLFESFDGQLMMVLHRPFDNARGKLYEMELTGSELRVVRQRVDLDGGG
ncbi:glycoside hydrolase family 43 protein [Actinopolymorpha pittospori]|uniref:Beta-xylosidase n=1 Tax=Actinopolymorpha pittospori TaxID=648752 RepID=A0A927MX64_9ACTN|nr:glycoside hydrolase family 43 protein [Actinopolymorpha pittospori]MBE1607882.1 beta-xylosidase [Actinopolymorpha pittospori]